MRQALSLVLALILAFTLTAFPQGGGQVRPTTALDVGTPFLWLKANRIAQASGSAVAQWNDLSGNARHFAQATGSKQPVVYHDGTRSYVRFDGSNDLLTASFSLSQPYTVFLVMSPVALNSAGARVLDDTSGTTNFTINYNFPNAGETSVAAGSTFVSGGYGQPVGAFSVVQVIVNGASSSISVSGQTAVTGNPGSASISGLAIGGLGTGGGSLMANVDVAEVLIYSGGMSAGKAAALRRALEQEYRVFQKRGVVTEGDSITQGGNCAGDPYPTQLAALLGNEWSVTNQGESGQNIDQMLSAQSTQVLRNKSGYRAKNVIVFFGGTNNLVTGESAASVTTKAQSWITAALNAGFQVIHVTTLPRSAVGVPGGFEAARQTYNDNMRTWCAGQGVLVADAGADATIGEPGDSDNLTYFCDKVHPTGAGFAIIAALVKAAMDTLP